MVMKLSEEDMTKMMKTGRMVLFDDDGNILREYQGITLPNMEQAVHNASQRGKTKMKTVANKSTSSLVAIQDRDDKNGKHNPTPANQLALKLNTDTK